jgi:predicted nuclease of predicted toxin-antitoxin system
MRILFDESMPKPLAADLIGHSVRTVVQCGWTGAKNGRLLTLAAQNFDVLITADRNIRHQQNLKSLPVAVIVLATPDGLLPSFKLLVPKLLATLANLTPRTLTELQL